MRIATLALLLLAASGVVYAQCPAGIPNTPGCIPPDGRGWRHNMPAQNPSQPAPSPRPKWSSRWGAVAIDTSNNAVGAASAAVTKRAAEKEALAYCSSKGGGGCKISLTYTNQCGVVAWGDDGFYAAAHAATVPLASELAMDRCAESSNNCKVLYSDCAYAVPAQ